MSLALRPPEPSPPGGPSGLSPRREPAWLAAIEILLVGGLVAAPLLADAWAALLVFLLSLAWLSTRTSRERRIAGPILAVAVVALIAGWAAGRLERAARSERIRETRREYAEIWKDLRTEAHAAAAVLKVPAETPAARLQAFSRLSRIEIGEGKGRRALLLLDPDGVPVAWAGEGLLHELPPELPRQGSFYRGSFSAMTLLVLEPLGDLGHPWRVAAGVSFPTDTLPFPRSQTARSQAARWTVVDNAAQAVPGADLVTLPGAPTLVVQRTPEPPETLGGSLADRVAWAALGLAFLTVTVLRVLRLLLPGGPAIGPAIGEDRVASLVSPLAMGGLIALGAAVTVPPRALIVLLAGLAVAALGLRARAWEGDRVPAWIKGAAAVVALLLAAWGLQRLWGPLDLADGIWVSNEAFALRLGLAGAAFGLFCLAGPRRGEPAPPPADRVVWIAVALLLGGGALCDQPLLAVPLLVAGGALAAVHAGRRRLREGLALVALVLMAIFAAAGTWETVYRLRLREYAGGELLARLAPPRPEGVAAVSAEIRRHFQAIDLDQIVPRSPAGLERQDLAYALWKDSPLSRHHSLSALVVQRENVATSSFSFGMPLTDQGVVDQEHGRWEELSLPLWHNGFLISGVVPLRFGGQPWGTIRYWLLPRPGFEVHDARRLTEVDVGLLKGGAGAAATEEIAQPALYALYTPDGRASLSPWEEDPPLQPELLRAGGRRARAVVETPTGRARAWARASSEGWEVIYLPFLGAIEALERTGNWSLGVLILLAFAAPPLLLLALPRATFRDLVRRTVQSYSKRLMLVYTLLLLIPLVFLYFVLVQSMGERLRRDQRTAGEAALSSAQQLLGQQLLTMPPGFGVDTVFGDQLLISTSGIVRHEVNLYYGSALHASSRHELFTAGLLPKRIPGEIYRRLALLGYGLYSRSNRVGTTNYLEMYAPLRLPGGGPSDDERLFLSIPLLAQQEEGARQLAQLRRQGLLVTAALFTLLVAVGRRLASNFTRPLMQLVAGTRRIAAGAPSLDLAPTELELALLVEAIDEMARKIADARERLVREKQVSERMVENITSGVVSLDQERRVLMHNRVAAELLGTTVGGNLEAAVAGRERLRPVADFLRTTGAEMARATVRLAAAEGGGESEWSLIWVPLPGAGEPSALLVVEDATEVLRSQRLLAWAEMARMIAHEIKNPLTPIRLSTEHMVEVYRHDPEHFDRVFERCTTNILTQVDELRSIASEFSAYSSIPRIDPKPADLVASMADLVEGYRAAPPPGVSVEFEPESPEIVARFDAKLLQRAVRNLIENALRATTAGGGRVTVRLDRLNGFARIAVLDSGPGVPPDLLPRIFDPYFSTHDTGTGLGLPIARRIAEEHGGGITARNRSEGGLEVMVTLPAVQP
ncbi:MAG TPA: ATP-binding protein [Thermoanaerobaculia bacterium]|nr:ATP-binding protein [Thermoanaerobaculia bacterium]